jgi:hypothetical protein
MIKYSCILYSRLTKGNMMKNGMKMKPIGELRASMTVFCEICGCGHKRRLKVKIYDQEEVENAKIVLTERAKKPYTCRICKTIKREFEYGSKK